MLAKDFEPMKLEEVIQAIEAAKVKRDFMYELTPANKQILSRRNGTFEAVLTGKGEEKCLIPEVGVLHYLYRGQNEEVVPCLPTIYRGGGVIFAISLVSTKIR